MKRFYLSHSNNISAAYIWVVGGSNLDKKNKQGINQILCSNLTRGCKSLDNFEISNLLDFNGAELNFEILQDGIYIGIKALKEYFENIYPLLDLIVNEPILSEKEFLKCKTYQINYLLKSKENLFSRTYDNWRKIVYKEHPYKHGTNGYLNTISNIHYEDLLKEYENFHIRNKYLISNHEIKNSVNINSENYNQKHSIKQKVNPLDQVNHERYIDINLSTNQIIIMLGNQTCSHYNEDYLCLKLLESYLSFGMSSVLFKLFREKNGLAYDVGVINPVRIENAPFVIYLSVSSNNAKLAFQLLINLWKEISTQHISPKHLKLSKTKLKNAILMSNQTVEEILLRKVQLLGYQMDPNFDLSSITLLEKINSEMIYKAVNKYFKKPFLSLLGESKTCTELKEIWKDNS
tara:strand:- start:1840 stop:3054 length:1215 start_codon:yes stop_codon:yes gene_type:complete